MLRDIPAMKKILSAALVTLALTGLSARPASAGAFGLIPHGGCCGCCGCNFCIRQYNAFSPVCCGTVYCDGCMPFGSGAPGCLGYSGFPASGPWNCLDGSCVGQLPPAEVMPAAPAAPPLQSLPSAMPKGPPAATAGPAQPGVYSAGYRPAFYPGYGYGYGYAPQAPVNGPGSAPAYWNGQ
jgi:hypothetical protein